MGVPAFFRWLSKKYPSILLHCVEEKPKEVGDETIPVDTSQPNPNDYEFDNLYLDMNGIIHPCCHPEDKPAPKNENEMMVLIFEYIDRIFSIVRPRKVLYMAIDGVAPRAKMNQQRSRRFRASKEITEKIEEMARLRSELTQKGCDLPPEKEKGEHFDSNCITPGTPFMFRLADCLRYYIHDRINTDPGWQNIKVILSDANVPGEGEHKIMDYIRRQRDQPDHDPNTKHCLNGADADLIMLGLATHEPHFTIIREEFKPNKPRSCDMCGQMGHEMKDCTGLPKEKVGEHDDGPVMFDSEQQFIFLRLNILREYLERELLMTNLPFKYDFERSLDDWVFMCFFVGNDFLPHLPSLEIRENAIDRLIKLYKNCVRRTGGYLTDSGVVNLSRVQIIMQELGEVEDEIFKKRRNNELEFQRRNKERKAREKRFSQGPRWTPGGQFAPQALGQSHSSSVSNPRQEAYKGRVDAMQSMMTKDEPGKGTKRSAPDSDDTEKTEKEKEKEEEEEKEPEDEVKLWEDGWKDRYYKSKFDVDKDDIEFRHNVARHYVTGLSWVLRYYYQGCASWKWYFPYHYAPFASDFVNISDLPNDFEKHTNPFKPLEQLMGVFPAGSKKHLPLTWQTLMFDPESPIIDFYPTDFRIDLNGKKYAWQGVALLPFVDEKRLLKGLETVYSDLTPEEVFRNGRGKDRLFVGKRHPAYSFFEGLYEGERSEEGVEVNPSLTHGMAGRVWCDDKATMSGETIKSPLPQPEMKDILDNQCLCILYKDPVYDDDHLFPSKVLPNAKMPERVLKPEDFDQRNRGKSWMPQLGFQKHSGYRGDRKDSSAANRMLRGSMGRGNNQGGRGWNRQSMYKSHSAPSLRYPRGGGYGGGYGGAQGYGGGGGGGGYNSGNNRGGGQRYGNQGNQGWQGNMKNQGNAYNRNQQQGGYGGYQGGGGGYNQGGGNWGGNQGGGNWGGNQQGGSNWGGNQRGGNRNQQQYRGGGGGGGNYNSNNRGQDRYRPY
ncbi:5'-3' exoribonuclease 2 [Mytilus galloprovincialis]|uniref:5'-3' exoribonuclease n=1 Tax=Mytilus galloprovincialis TaxID=29158 RepID=A0A8B6HRC5_MYTGA|nr:5'-3' exoribonuclease 2 [Mytilus galloprovincialis]